MNRRTGHGRALDTKRKGPIVGLLPSGTGILARLRLVGVARWLLRSRDRVDGLLPHRRGSVGWLVKFEMRYAPVVDSLPGLTSESNPSKYFSGDLGGDKMSRSRNAYSKVYAEVLEPWLDRSFVLVELGVFQGSSLAIWADLFPDAEIIGLDLEFGRFESNLENLRDRGAFPGRLPGRLEFDAFAPDVSDLQALLGARSIGIFIDDGPHHDDAILATARAILPLMAEEFLYIVEDNSTVGAALAHEFPGLLVQRRGAITILTRRG